MLRARSVVKAGCRALCLGVLALVTLAVVGGLVTGESTAPASAAPGSFDPVAGRSAAPGAVPTALVPGGGGGSMLGICPSTPTGSEQIANEKYLPVNRWSSATSDIHTRLSADFWNDVGAKLQRNVIDSTYLTIGNANWSAATSLTSFASRFCVGESIGYQIDKGAAAIGDAIMGNTDTDGDSNWVGTGAIIPMMLVSALIATIIWRKARGQGSWKPLGRATITLAVMGSLLVGAQGTDASGNDAGSFGLGSPGWWASRANMVISGVASAPAMALNEQVTSGETSITGLAESTPGDTLSCKNYMYELRQRYVESYNTSSLTALSTAAVPMSMDAMWQTSGLSAYINTQFGTRNEIGERVFCHQLEYSAGTAPTAHKALATGQAIEDVTSADEQPWAPYNNAGIDRAVISFAVCRGDAGNPEALSVNSMWNGVTNDGSSPNDTGWNECEDTFSTADADAENENMFFNWEDDAQNIMDGTGDNPQVRDFLLSYHGNASSGGSATAFIHMLTSFVVLVVFGLLSFAIIGAKIGLWVMVLFVFVALLANLFTREHGADKAVQYAKRYLGMALFAFGAALLLSSIALVTAVLQSVGTAFGEMGSTLSIIWTGLSPVIALMVIKFIFTDLLKAPSPFKPSSAFAYGAASGAMGGAAMLGADRLLDRGKDKAKGGAKSATKKVANAGYGAASKQAGKKSREGGMEPTAGTRAGQRSEGSGNAAPAATAAAAAAGTAGAMTGGSAAQRRKEAERLAKARKTTDQAEDALHTHDSTTEQAENAPRSQAGHEQVHRKKLKEGARLRREGVTGRAEHGVGTRTLNKGAAAGKDAGDRAKLAFSKFKDKPLRSTAKGAAVVGGLAALPGAAPVALGGAAALYGANRLRHRVDDRKGIREGKDVDAMKAYTRAQQRRRAGKERDLLLAERGEQQRHDDATFAGQGDQGGGGGLGDQPSGFDQGGGDRPDGERDEPGTSDPVPDLDQGQQGQTWSVNSESRDG